MRHTLVGRSTGGHTDNASVADMTDVPTAAEVAAILLDDGTAHEFGADVDLPTDPEYAATLTRARAKSGSSESVRTWRGTIAGVPTMLVAGEFTFLAGSVGIAAAEQIVAAIQVATAEGRAIVSAPTSGGTRMQEGTPAFVRMVPIAAALASHRAAGYPIITWLRHPTTGGVMATWGSLGQVTAAQPGALAGFLGPRVYELVVGQPFPEGVQTAENLARVGVIDEVVPVTHLRQWAAKLLTAMTARRSDSPTHAPSTTDPALPTDTARARMDAWDAVLATRSPMRPGVRELLTAVASDVTELSGTGEGERDDAILLALARISGVGVVVVGQDRSAGHPFGPAGLRTARRGYRLATELGLVLVTVIDTEGAELSPAAEEGAMAGEIARSLAELSQVQIPVVSVLLGSGCGGGALAMLPADRVLAAADSWVTPLPPEGAAAIVHRDLGRAPEMARAQRITAADLAERGVVDVVFTGMADGAPAFLTAACDAVGDAVAEAIVSPRRVSRFV